MRIQVPVFHIFIIHVSMPIRVSFAYMPMKVTEPELKTIYEQIIKILRH